MKQIKSLLDKIEEDLAVIGLPAEVVTLSTLVYNHTNGTTRTGSLKFNLAEVIEALDAANKKLNKIKKLEKRVSKLEKKRK